MSVNAADSEWTDERIAVLRRMHAAGATFSEIGLTIGVSKNACIGKAKRLGLSLRRIGGTPRKPRKSRAKPKSEHKKIFHIVRAGYGSGLRVTSSVATEMPEFSCIELEPLNKSLAELGADECKYIAGDPRDSAVYCGHPVFKRSYCSDHFARCYVEPIKRWRTAA